MLDPENFSLVRMDSSQVVEVEKLKIGEAVWNNAEIKFGYSENWRLIFDLTPFAQETLSGRRSAQTLEGIEIVISKGHSKTNLHLTQLPFMLVSDDQKVLATSLSEPISLANDYECKSFEFVVLAPRKSGQIKYV